MPGKPHVVRVISFSSYANGEEGQLKGTSYQDVGPLVECLRYMGVVQVHATGQVAASENRLVFDILPPRQVIWDHDAAQNLAERMKTFGFNAAAAPMCPPDSETGSKGGSDEVRCEQG